MRGVLNDDIGRVERQAGPSALRGRTIEVSDRPAASDGSGGAGDPDQPPVAPDHRRQLRRSLGYCAGRTRLRPRGPRWGRRPGHDHRRGFRSIPVIGGPPATRSVYPYGGRTPLEQLPTLGFRLYRVLLLATTIGRSSTTKRGWTRHSPITHRGSVDTGNGSRTASAHRDAVLDSLKRTGSHTLAKTNRRCGGVLRPPPAGPVRR